MNYIKKTISCQGNRALHDEILESSGDIFSIRLQMKLNTPPSPAAKQISSTTSGYLPPTADLVKKSQVEIRLGFFPVLPLQNQYVPQIFSKYIHGFRSADRLITWR